MLTAVAGRPLSYMVRADNRTPKKWSASGADITTVGVYYGPVPPDNRFVLIHRTPMLCDIWPNGGANVCVHLPNPPPPGEWSLVHRIETLDGRWAVEVNRLPIRVGQLPPARPAGVNVIGYLASEKGVGEAARSIVRGLRAANVPHSLIPVPDGGSENTTDEFGPTTGDAPYSVNLISANPDALPHVLWQMRPDFAAGRYTVGYWFWELPRLPREWERWFPTVQEVWVSSRFTQRAVATVSPVPVVYIPLSLSPVPPAGVVSRESLRLPAKAFVFLFVFDVASSLARKNPAGPIRAFRAAFPDEPDVRLVLKFSHAERHAGMNEVLAEVAGDLRIVPLSGVWPRGHIQDLLRLADCYISLHRSEGFGLTCAEAMAAGKPVIATDWSGTTDFVNPDTGFPIRCTETPIQSADGLYRPGDVWAEPDLAHAAGRMRQVFADRESAARTAEAGRVEVTLRFTAATVGAAIIDRLAALTRIGRVRGFNG